MLSKIITLVALAVPYFMAASANPDAASNIVRPCAFDDYKCIADNLSANSKCGTTVQGSIPSQYTLNNFRFETPFFNSSFIEQYVIIRNHDKCFVSEFFFNMASDSAVLALDCPLLDFEANRTLIQHRSLLEDTEYSYTIRGEYPLIRLTTTLRHADSLNICSAFTFADVTALPIFRVDPNNKPTANFLSKDLSALYIYERETFLYRASLLFRTFVNSIICDFACNS